jgi:hypothetical protein
MPHLITVDAVGDTARETATKSLIEVDCRRQWTDGAKRSSRQ